MLQRIEGASQFLARRRHLRLCSECWARPLRNRDMLAAPKGRGLGGFALTSLVNRIGESIGYSSGGDEWAHRIRTISTRRAGIETVYEITRRTFAEFGIP